MPGPVPGGRSPRVTTPCSARRRRASSLPPTAWVPAPSGITWTITTSWPPPRSGPSSCSWEISGSTPTWCPGCSPRGPSVPHSPGTREFPASARLCLDRRRWTTTLHCETPAFQAEGDRQWLKRRLSERIEASVTSLTEDLDGWTLPLSGGYDSRAILCYLARTMPDVGQIRTLTWGVQSERERSGGDARVAARLADTMGVGHRFQTTDIAREPVSGILDRFLLCSEGRIDHLAAYADGMAIWRQLHDEGVKGIIRGDEGFGWIPVTSPTSVRLRTGCALCRDFENLAALQDRYGLPEQ